MTREKMTSKLFVCGIDAMDPRLTKKYIDKGLMPNAKKILSKGSARKDLMLLGAMPTVTPPQWTTLATGAYPETHGITAFYRLGSDLDKIRLSLDSHFCHAEQIWNVTAEAGYKTLVYHWPGSSWPPSSDNPNLSVIDGSSTGSVNMSTGQVGEEYLMMASEQTDGIAYRSATNAESTSNAPCVITGLNGEESLDAVDGGWGAAYDPESAATSQDISMYIVDPFTDGQGGYLDVPIATGYSPIKMATGWKNAPANAKEFVLLLSGGLIRRNVLICSNEDGIYDRIEIYKNKKCSTPIATIANKEYFRDYMDDVIRGDEVLFSNRDIRVLEIKPDGSLVRMWVSAAMIPSVNKMWHPQSLHQKILENVGFPPPSCTWGGGDKELILGCMHSSWEHVLDFQSGALLYCMEQLDYEVVFSHFHAPDLQKHMFIRYLKSGRPERNMTSDDYEEIMEAVYTQIDRYLGRFVHLLDQGWTIIVTSDHAQVCPTYGIRGLGDMGVNIQLMEELGYTVLKTNEKGNKLREIDWTKTKAVANREMHIYLNLKGRTDHGIIDPKDQYELEEEIMTALYGYKDPISGQRIISFALRRKDAAIIGLGGDFPACGDIIYCMAEGYEHDHDDSLPTSCGECDTSVSPVFIAAGSGIKENFLIKRMIRQVDVAPTIAVLLGTRMPAQCEGAPIYQIFTQEY